MNTLGVARVFCGNFYRHHMGSKIGPAFAHSLAWQVAYAQTRTRFKASWEHVGPKGSHASWDRQPNAAPRITKPFPRHFTRRVFEEVVRPRAKYPAWHDADHCSKRSSVIQPYLESLRQLNPVELSLRDLIMKTVLPRFPVVAVCQFLPMPGRHLRVMKGRMTLDGLHFKIYTSRVMRDIIQGTKYENLTPLLTGQTALIFSEKFQLGELHKHLKKNGQQIALLGVAVEDQLLSASEFHKLAAIPGGLESLPAQTSALLSSGSREASRLLDGQAVQLTANLAARVEMLQLKD